MGFFEDHRSDQQAQSADQEAVKRLNQVEDQLILVRRGQLKFFTCPYCEGTTEVDAQFCCATMAKAVEAVLQRQEIKEQTDVADEIAGNIHSKQFMDAIR